MYSHIYWHAYFKANSADKVRKLLAKVEDACETSTVLEACAPYWKDASLYEVSFRTPLSVLETADAVFEALVNAGRLAASWEVSGPVLSSAGIWEFRGVAVKSKVTGIEWIAFRI